MYVYIYIFRDIWHFLIYINISIFNAMETGYFRGVGINLRSFSHNFLFPVFKLSLHINKE